MAKKKSSKKVNLGLILSVVVLALGVASFCMAFVTSVNYNGKLIETGFTGIQTMFGYTATAGVAGFTVSGDCLAFSFMATLAFVLPLIGAILCLTKNKIARFIGAGLMVAGAVLLFLLPSFVVLAKSGDNYTAAATVLSLIDPTLGVGAILGGIFAGLGGLVGLYGALRK